MSYALVLLYFILKHVWVSHCWDVGYSAARRPSQRRWWYFHLLQILSELCLTVLLYACAHVHHWHIDLTFEALGLTVGLAVERKATYRTLLVMHLISESSMMVLYTLLAWTVVHR